MAAVLRVHPADIKIVEVREGSTIVNFKVLQRDVESMEEGKELLDLKQIDKDYRKFVKEEDTFMGSRILDASVEDEQIKASNS